MRWLVAILSFLFSARAALSVTPTPVDLKKLPAAAFKALPDSALVEIDGRRMTKAQFIAEMESLRSRMTAIKPPSARNAAPPDFSVTRTRILDKEKSRLAAENARLAFVAQDNMKMAPTPTPDPCTQPRITAMSGAPPLEPGEQIILNGCGFGLRNSASELRFVSNDFPGGFLKLQILHWQGNAIQAVVPPISGVKDQPAKLQIVRKDLQVSNEWPASFYATRDVTKLSLAHLTQTCSSGGGYKECPYSFASSGWTFSGYHGSGDSDKAYYSGTDTVSGDLKNQCVLAGIGWVWFGSNGTLTADPTATTVTGNAHLSVNLPWVLGDHGGVAYAVDLYALGPVGVPCH